MGLLLEDSMMLANATPNKAQKTIIMFPRGVFPRLQISNFYFFTTNFQYNYSKIHARAC